eukprot:GEMP01029659.1.p1 GENE.GEMP01029659.1~~GEMP01029659.1.p1  ORF type:complete len:229 (+),score=62.72 GEMP01029659.1:132-818(+)
MSDRSTEIAFPSRLPGEVEALFTAYHASHKAMGEVRAWKTMADQMFVERRRMEDEALTEEDLYFQRRMEERAQMETQKARQRWKEESTRTQQMVTDMLHNLQHILAELGVANTESLSVEEQLVLLSRLLAHGLPSDNTEEGDNALLTLLPTHKYTEEEKGTDCHKSECLICLETYGIGEDVKTLPCFHVFHSTCVDEWLRISQTCATCRTPLDKDKKSSLLKEQFVRD